LDLTGEPPLCQECANAVRTPGRLRASAAWGPSTGTPHRDRRSWPTRRSAERDGPGSRSTAPHPLPANVSQVGRPAYQAGFNPRSARILLGRSSSLPAPAPRTPMAACSATATGSR